MSAAPRLIALGVIVASLAGAVVASPAFAGDRPQSEWVYPGPKGKLVYKTTPAGDRIMDFSHAGYMGGGVALPTVPVKRTVKPSGGEDDAAAIQAAIDEVSALPLVKGFRGAVLLAPGVYSCPKPRVHRRQRRRAARQRQRAGQAADHAEADRQPAPGASPCARRRRSRAGEGAGRRQPEAAGPERAITDAYVPSGATTPSPSPTPRGSPSATPSPSAGRSPRRG